MASPTSPPSPTQPLSALKNTANTFEDVSVDPLHVPKTRQPRTRSLHSGNYRHSVISTELKRVGTPSSITTNATFQTAVGSIRDLEDDDREGERESESYEGGVLRGAVMVVQEEDEHSSGRSTHSQRSNSSSPKPQATGRRPSKADSEVTTTPVRTATPPRRTASNRRVPAPRKLSTASTTSRSSRNNSPHRPSGSARNSDTTLRPARQPAPFLLRSKDSAGTFPSNASTTPRTSRANSYSFPKKASQTSSNGSNSSTAKTSTPTLSPESPSKPHPATRATSVDWRGDEARAAEYAEVDRRRKSFWGRISRVMCCVRREEEYYDGGEDTGSVRRYRLDGK